MHGRQLTHRFVLIATAGIGLALLSSINPARAQAPYAIPLMSAERVRAFSYAADHNQRFLPGRVLVKFRKGTTVGTAQRAIRNAKSQADVNAASWSGDVAVLQDDAETDPPALAKRLMTQFDAVEFAQPDYIRHLHVIPNDPDFSLRQWNFTAIDLPRAWDINYGATSSIVVALVDTGVTVVPAQNLFLPTYIGSTIQTMAIPVGPSPDLDPARFFLPADFLVSLTSPSSQVIDTDSHGTHVASTMAESTNNAKDLAGIAFNAKIMPVKVCASFWDLEFAAAAVGAPKPSINAGGCADSAIVAGIRYAADNGANVLNISLGGPDPDPATQAALQYAVSKGVFVSISMGNSFPSPDPEYPAFYAAQIDGVMSVAAVGLNNVHAAYSSTGTHCEISAPGGDVTNGGLAGTVFQDTLVQTDILSTLTLPRFDRYAEAGFQGTSMASPHVAGVAALIKSTYPSLSPAAIEKLIEKTALDLGGKGRDSTFGYGLIQPRAALAGTGIVR